MDQLGSDMLIDSDLEEKRFEDVAIITPEADDDSMQEEAQVIRADDFDAIRDHYLPLLPDHDVESEIVNTWDIENWRSLPKRTHGPVFKCGDHPWRILFFPYGNNASEAVSFYLESGFGDEKPPDQWYACVQFMLVLWNPNDPTMYVHHEANHRFTAEEGDWGFTRFAEKNKIFAPKYDTFDRPMVENDGAKVTAYVRVLKDPTGVLWHNFVNYDSKKETSMVGLTNQGATCYLNSLLQSLYLTGAFRKAVYQIPTETDQDRQNSFSAYMLQRLFYRLQTDKDAVSTNELTLSFGWESRDTFQQQDVQELSRILMDRLEARMKGTEAEKALPTMFKGSFKTYLKCINVNYESSRLEDFWDLQLNVSGCKSMDESFKEYIQVETLEGENRYAAEGYGLQDTKKGVIFEAFPEVLHLQLKRFEYNIDADRMMKVNDRYEFPEIWDATPYLDADADKSEPYIYHLHGVLVHSGDINAGHYYAFLKPNKRGDFFRFDDDRVTKSLRREAIDDNFGGDYAAANGINSGLRMQNPHTRNWSTKKSNNAYMLVYIRESRLDKILLPEDQLQPPSHIPAKLQDERTIQEKRRKDREEAHLYMSVHVASLAQYNSYHGADIVPWGSDDETDQAMPYVFRLLKTLSVGDFTEQMGKHMQVDADLVRPWIMVNRQNGTTRPDHPLSFPNMTIEEAATKYSTRNTSFKLFLETTARAEDGTPIWPIDLTNGFGVAAPKLMIIFLKYFDVEKQELTGKGHVYMSSGDKVQELATPILQIMGWEVGTNLELFEEIKHNFVEALKPKQTLIASEIQDGDIVCFQNHFSETEADAIKENMPSASLSAPQYYDYLVNRVSVTFTPKFTIPQNVNFENPDDSRFALYLSKKDTYDTLASLVAEHLESLGNTVNPSHIRFTTANVSSGKPRSIVKRTPASTMSSILLGTGGYGYGSYAPTQAPDQLFYEVMEMSLSDLEQRKDLKVTWLSEGITKEEPYNVLVPKQAQFSEVLQTLQKSANLPNEILDHIRFYEAHTKKVYKILPSTHSVVALNEFMDVYAERIPDEEAAMDKEKGDRLIYCFHFDKEPAKTHNVPFLFAMKDGEVFKETKERLIKRTGIKGKQFEKIKFASIKGGATYSRPVWIEDDDILSEKLGPDDHLGLDHPNKNRNNLVKYESLNIR